MTYPAALKQKFVILVKAHLQHYGCSPSYDQIRIALGFKSKHRVFNLVDCLVREGIIQRRAGGARCIELLASEYHHTPDCLCDGCAHSRYLRDLMLVHALKVVPPLSAAVLKDLRAFTLAERDAWFARKRRSKPRKLSLKRPLHDQVPLSSHAGTKEVIRAR